MNGTAPLKAGRLAEELGITVWSTTDVDGLGQRNLNTLNSESDDSWSALTMRMGPKHLIIFKPVLSLGRRNSVIMHELSHIILGHKLADAIILDDGSLVPGNFDQDQEDEANWLAGTLLLPRPALMHIRRNELSDEDVVCTYEVSTDMLNWRMRMTGVNYQFDRAQNRRKR